MRYASIGLLIIILTTTLALAKPGGGSDHNELSTEHGDLADDHTVLLEQLDQIRSLLIKYPLCGVETEAQRFILSADGMEVCDNTTGLYWEQLPNGGGTWSDAVARCAALDLGNGQTYRLPEIGELYSLVDYSRSTDTSNWAIPAENPFSDVDQGGAVFTFRSSSSLSDPVLTNTVAWQIKFNIGEVLILGKASTGGGRAWCVR